MRVVIATFSGMPPEFTDDLRLGGALRALGAQADRISWDDAHADWESFDAVVVRSTWDYSGRHIEFLEWVDSVGDRLHNSPALIRWNSDKRYVGDLAQAGLPVVDTTFVEPGAQPPALAGEVVIKPAVSAGALDTGRFSAQRHGEGRELIAKILATGRVAMVQPYQASVEEHGETAVVFIDGLRSHVLRKRAILAPDEVAPARGGELGIAAEPYYDPGLVTAGEASTAELALAGDVIAHVSERFAYVPLYARVDMLAGPDGPRVLELEAIEPNLYLDQASAAADRLARAIIERRER
jgi:hypothetical protein